MKLKLNPTRLAALFATILTLLVVSAGVSTALLIGSVMQCAKGTWNASWLVHLITLACFCAQAAATIKAWRELHADYSGTRSATAWLVFACLAISLPPMDILLGFARKVKHPSFFALLHWLGVAKFLLVALLLVGLLLDIRHYRRYNHANSDPSNGIYYKF